MNEYELFHQLWLNTLLSESLKFQKNNPLHKINNNWVKLLQKLLNKQKKDFK